MAADELIVSDVNLRTCGKLATSLQQGKQLDDVTLLREVMNTVVKHGQLGQDIPACVSVSMLTEGWDANTLHTCSCACVRHSAFVRSRLSVARCVVSLTN